MPKGRETTAWFCSIRRGVADASRDLLPQCEGSGAFSQRCASKVYWLRTSTSRRWPSSTLQNASTQIRSSLCYFGPGLSRKRSLRCVIVVLCRSYSPSCCCTVFLVKYRFPFLVSEVDRLVIFLKLI
jgi:hypothetical protein